MGIGDFCTCITGKTVFSNNSAVTTDYCGRQNVDEIYFDFDSIPHMIPDVMEEEINGLRWDCINEKTTEKGKETIQKYGINVPIDSETNQVDYKGLLDNINNLDITPIAINMVLDYIQKICDTYTIPDGLKYIYISSDGMPNMSKIFEQKKRKYGKKVRSKIQHHIYEELNHTLPEKRKQYEAKKFRVCRSILTPHIDKEGNILEKLQSKEFLGVMAQKFPQLQEIKINHRSRPGEGEKKIMEEIISRKNGSNCLIYSPDSDLVMISVILSTIVASSKFYVLRRNQVKGTYELFDSDQIITNIHTMARNYMRDTTKTNRINVVRDIAFVMSLFGNDFIPKMATIDINIHHGLLFKTYAEIYMKMTSGRDLVIRDTDGRYEFNCEFLIEFINLLKESEHFLYADMYIKKNYNIKHLIPYMIKPTLGETLHLFVKAINKKLFCNVKRYKYSNAGCKERIIERTVKELLLFFGVKNIHKVINTKSFHITTAESRKKSLCHNDMVGYNNTTTFMKFFLNSHYMNLYISTVTTLHDAVKIAYEKFDPNKRYLLLRPRSIGIDIESDYAKGRIKKTLPRSDMEITDYDREIFKMTCKLPPYNVMYNYYPRTDNIGRIYVEYFNVNGNPSYRISQHTAIQSCNQYMRDYIKIDPNSTKSKNSISQQYVTGLYWVMNFYMNRNSSQENIKYVSSWAYPHKYSPTLYMLSMYFEELKKTVYRNLSKKIPTFRNVNPSDNKIVGVYMREQAKRMFSLSDGIMFVEREKFLSPEEHWMFISPYGRKDSEKVSTEYQEFRKNHAIFPNITNVVDEMYEAKKQGEKIRSPYDINGDFRTDLVPYMPFKTYINLLSEHNPGREIPSLTDVDQISVGVATHICVDPGSVPIKN